MELISEKKCPGPVHKKKPRLNVYNTVLVCLQCFFVLFFHRAAKEKARAKEQQKKVIKVKLPNALAVIAYCLVER